MLNVGPLELVVVLAVALIVVGPERLPDLARSVGRALRQLRQVQDEVRDMVSMGVDDDVRRAASDFRKATNDLTQAADVKGSARKASRVARTQVRKSLEPAERSTAAGADDVATPAVTPDVAPIDGPAEPDTPTGPDGSMLAPAAPAEGPNPKGPREPTESVEDDPAERP
jgi:Tat protein translocase TatB subunit